MVRNHQDGYPYLNLSSFFFFWKLPETLIVLVNSIGQWIHGDEGRGITRDIKKKNILIFNTLQKMVTKLGQFTNLKCKEGSQKICQFFFFFWKLPETPTVLVNLIGQWIHRDEGRRNTKDIQKSHFHVQHSTKNGNKVGTFYKAEM